MDIIIGGKYQGKLDYAKKKYQLTDDDLADFEEHKRQLQAEDAKLEQESDDD